MANLFIPSISKIGPHRSGETNFYEGGLSKGLGQIGKEGAAEVDGEFAQKLLNLLGINSGTGSENVEENFDDAYISLDVDGDILVGDFEFYDVSDSSFDKISQFYLLSNLFFFHQ